MEQARALIMGLGVEGGVAPVDWLLPYPDTLAPTADNPRGVAFRRVRHIRVCSHVDKAPEVTGIGAL